MMICKNCGNVMSDDEIDSSSSYLASTGDIEYYEKVGQCPYCHSDELVEARRCQLCGEWFDKAELSDGICAECEKRDEIIEEIRL